MRFYLILHRNGDIIYKGKINEPDDLTITGCDPRDKFTVMVHGWTQSCDKDVMKILAQSKSLEMTSFDSNEMSGNCSRLKVPRTDTS